MGYGAWAGKFGSGSVGLRVCYEQPKVTKIPNPGI